MHAQWGFRSGQDTVKPPLCFYFPELNYTSMEAAVSHTYAFPIAYHPWMFSTELLHPDTTAPPSPGKTAFRIVLHTQLRSCFSGTRYKKMVTGCRCSWFEQLKLEPGGNRHCSTEPQSQPLHACQLLQSLHHLCGSSLLSFQCVHISLAVESPSSAKQKDHLPPSAGSAFPNAAQVPFATFPARAFAGSYSIGVHQHSQVLFCQAAFQMVYPSFVAGQDSAFYLT